MTGSSFLLFVTKELFARNVFCGVVELLSFGLDWNSFLSSGLKAVDGVAFVEEDGSAIAFAFGIETSVSGLDWEDLLVSVDSF